MTAPRATGLFLLLAALGFSLVPAFAEEPAKERKEEKKPAMLGGSFEVESIKDITYCEGDEADADKHRLNVFFPKGQKDFPVLFFIHGGTWSSGDRKLYTPLGETFAK